MIRIIKIQLKLTGDFSNKFKKNDICDVDAIKLRESARSGVCFRVRNMGKKPIWLDYSWLTNI